MAASERQFAANRANNQKIRAGWWTDERVDLLLCLWGDGNLSARDIAEKLGTTRAAVLGKANRLALEFHPHAARFNPHLRPKSIEGAGA